jgi:peptidoglycan/LPS O-acetylase OafA/YrhL
MTALVNRLSAWALIAAATALLALTWISTALAEADGDGDGFDGDELALPILGLAVLAVAGLIAFQRRSKNSPR